jgi:hypothetical protein
VDIADGRKTPAVHALKRTRKGDIKPILARSPTQHFPEGKFMTANPKKKAEILQNSPDVASVTVTSAKKI